MGTKYLNLAPSSHQSCLVPLQGYSAAEAEECSQSFFRLSSQESTSHFQS